MRDLPWRRRSRPVSRPSGYPFKTAQVRPQIGADCDKNATNGAASCPLFHKLVCPRCARGPVTAVDVITHDVFMEAIGDVEAEVAELEQQDAR
jgi:hypothetical protein